MSQQFCLIREEDSTRLSTIFTDKLEAFCHAKYMYQITGHVYLVFAFIDKQQKQDSNSNITTM